MDWYIWVILVVVFLGIAPSFVLSGVIYSAVLVRTKPEKWGRECSMPDDEELVRLYQGGAEWAAQFPDKVQEVSIENDGFTLWGEYFDFGSDKAVIIIPGRMEGCKYSYHFAIPYQRAGYNVLVIDNRCHGKSGGKYHSLGFKEYRDVIKWSELLHDRFGNSSVVLHGICIGSSVALFALTAPDCPDYLSAMVADGMYENFYESFRNHMVEQKRPLFPFLYIIMWYIRIFAGADVVKDGPVKRIGGMQKPILFLHSREDVYSVPEKAQNLFGLCASEHKKLVWFDHGEHSRIRLKNEAQYDAAVTEFLGELN